MHLLPIITGLGLAFGGIPVYHWIEYACHIQPLAEDEGYLWPNLVFVILPLGISILTITGLMLVVYNSVRSRAAASRKWRFGIGQASKLEQAVFWQAFSYLLAFYITWPIMFSVYLFSVDVKAGLGYTMTVAFVEPLQGFNNFLVYIRPTLKARSQHAFGNFNSTCLSRAWRTIIPGPAKHQSQTEGSAVDPDNALRSMDPSVVVAMDIDHSSYRPSEHLGVEQSSGRASSNDREKLSSSGFDSSALGMLPHSVTPMESVPEDECTESEVNGASMPEMPSDNGIARSGTDRTHTSLFQASSVPEDEFAHP